MDRFRFDPQAHSIVLRALVEEEQSLVVTMVLDVGASYTHLPWRILEAMGCDLTRPSEWAEVVTASGVETAPLISVRRITALNRTVENLQVLCRDLPPKARVDGLLGLNFLRHFNACLKFKEGIIEVE